MLTLRAMVMIAFAATIARAQTPTPTPTPSPTASPTESPAPKRFEVEWRVALSDAEDAAATTWLVPGDGQVFVSGAGAAVTAYSATDGRVAWTSTDRSVIPPVLAGPKLAIVTTDSLSVVDQASGEARWRVPLEGAGAPVVAFGSAERIAIAFEGSIQAWDATGKAAWRATFSGSPVTNVVMAGQLMVFGTGEPGLVAIDAASGTLRWKIALAAKPGLLAATVERVYFGSDDGKLYSYRTDGQPKWEWRQSRVRPIGQPVVDPKSVYFALFDNSIYAFGAGGGTQQWSHVLESRPLTGPLKLGETLGVAMTNGRVTEIEAKTGKPISPAAAASGPTVGVLTAASAIDGSRIYTVTITIDRSRTLVAWEKR